MSAASDATQSRAMKRVGALVTQMRAPATAPVAPIASGPTAGDAAAAAGASTTNPPELENVKVEVKGRVALVTMYRPAALNALSDGLINDVASAFTWASGNPGIGCVVLTGTGRAFAAGADIKEMKDASTSFAVVSTRDRLGPWRALQEVKIPVIAAVNGLALVGGCEIAMMQDIILASDKAVFGQPEVKLGILPGAGGTQRLPRFVGKSKAMELCLTGAPITAAEAERIGLVSRVVPHDQLLDVALKMAAQIASYSRPAVVLTKEAVNAAYDTTLAQGLQYERRLFHMTWGYSDAKEGTTAFAEKRAPKWQHK